SAGHRRGLPLGLLLPHRARGLGELAGSGALRARPDDLLSRRRRHLGAPLAAAVPADRRPCLAPAPRTVRRSVGGRRARRALAARRRPHPRAGGGVMVRKHRHRLVAARLEALRRRLEGAPHADGAGDGAGGVSLVARRRVKSSAAAIPAGESSMIQPGSPTWNVISIRCFPGPTRIPRRAPLAGTTRASRPSTAARQPGW